MTATIATAGFVPLDAPLPAPRRDDLLAVSPPQDLFDTSWWHGGWSEGYAPGPAFTHDPCASGTDRAKLNAGEIASQQAGIFVVYVPAFCTAQGIGPDPSAFIKRLEDIFLIYERAAVERVLATGDGHDDLGGYLGDANMEVLTASAVDPLAALKLLETEIARHSSGLIHAAPSTVVAWDALNLTMNVDGLTYTRRGTPIAVGAGYIDVVPDGAADLGDNEQWAFATGPVEVLRAREIDVPASTYEQLLDRSLNDVFVVAERAYLLNWLGRQSPADRDHVQAGVLVNESLCCLSLVDGGVP